METPHYAAEELAGIAQDIAQQNGCEAVRWWQDQRDPRFLLIEAKTTAPHAPSMRITLQAFLD